jgi:hypothetical protein
VVTAEGDKAQSLFPTATIVKCDATVIKTAARVTPTYFFMQGATILDKISYAEQEKIMQQIK